MFGLQLEIVFALVLMEDLIPDVKVTPVDQVENAEKDRRTDQEEPVDLGVLVVPRGVLLLRHSRLPPFPLEAVHPEMMSAALKTSSWIRIVSGSL